MDTCKTPGTADFLLLVLVAVLWAAAFPQIKVAVAEMSPAFVALGRVILALIAIAAYCIATDRLPTNWTRVLILSGPLGLLGMAAPFYFQNIAEQEITSGQTAVIMGTVPVLTVLVGALSGQVARLSWPMTIGVATSFAGIWLLIMGPNLSLSGGMSVFHIFALGAAFCYALNLLVAKKIDGVTPEHMSLGALFWASGLMAIAVFVSPGPLFLDPPAIEAWGALIGLGIGSTAGAAYLTFRLVQSVGPQFVALAVYLVPIFGLFLGVILLREAVSSADLLATGLILTGIWLATSGRRITGFAMFARIHSARGGKS